MINYKLINLDKILDKNYDDIIEFFRYCGIRKFDGCDIEALKNFTNNINEKSGFNVSYNIDRLDKEFDLVKIGNKKIINIELKLSRIDVSQCKKNLKLLKKYYKDYSVYVFCYEKESNKLYLYDVDSESLIKDSFDNLNSLLQEIYSPVTLNINYDVESVYINPEFFLKKKYTLSSAQSDIMEKIISLSNEKNIVFINGRAGTGKTVLALELYKYYESLGNEVIFLAPFKANEIISKDLRNEINIKTVKDFITVGNEYDYVIIDESQRLKLSDINKISILTKKKCLFFGDENQTFEYCDSFTNLISDRSNTVFNLNLLIRSEDTFELFARKLLNKKNTKTKYKVIDSTKIKVFMNYEIIPDLNDFIFLEPGKSKYFVSCEDNCSNRLCRRIGNLCSLDKTSYDVIGQDYKKVAISFCDKYYINHQNKLCASPGVCYSDWEGQLYSIITRTINELVIVVSDITVYNYVMRILEKLK